MESKSVATWNTMIMSLGVHGPGEEAIADFEEMERRDIKPDAITFTGVLSACVKTGKIDKARGYLYDMVKRYGIEPSFTYYVCLFEMYMAKLLDLESSERPSS